jgi:hypothetical protein
MAARCKMRWDEMRERLEVWMLGHARVHLISLVHDVPATATKHPCTIVLVFYIQFWHKMSNFVPPFAMLVFHRPFLAIRSWMIIMIDLLPSSLPNSLFYKPFSVITSPSIFVFSAMSQLHITSYTMTFKLCWELFIYAKLGCLAIPLPRKQCRANLQITHCIAVFVEGRLRILDRSYFISGLAKKSSPGYPELLTRQRQHGRVGKDGKSKLK